MIGKCIVLRYLYSVSPYDDIRTDESYDCVLQTNLGPQPSTLHNNTPDTLLKYLKIFNYKT